MSLLRWIAAGQRRLVKTHFGLVLPLEAVSGQFKQGRRGCASLAFCSAKQHDYAASGVRQHQQHGGSLHLHALVEQGRKLAYISISENKVLKKVLKSTLKPGRQGMARHGDAFHKELHGAPSNRYGIQLHLLLARGFYVKTSS